MPSDNNDPYPYSFDDQQPPQQGRRRHTEEDESLGESILEEIDEGFDVSGRLLGCVWSLLTLPIRFIGKIFGFIGDLFD